MRSFQYPAQQVMGLISVLLLEAALLHSTTAFLPLRSENLSGQTKHNRGCLFGDQYHTVGSSWHPNLGFPFGVMYCIRCDCVKYRVQGRSGKELTKVTCHDVRKDCPTVTCKDAKVQRGECCRTCPEDSRTDTETPSSKWDMASGKSDDLFEKTLNDAEAREEVNPKIKRFVALLSGESSSIGPYLARATFTLQRGNIHFTVHHHKSARPRLVQLIDGNGAVQYTHRVETSNSKRDIVCGVWRNLPKNLLSALEERNLSLRLTLGDENELLESRISRDDENREETYASGPIVQHRALNSETFSSLMYPQQDGEGGAIVMMTLGRNFKQINFAVMFRNIAPVDSRRRKGDLPVTVTVELRNNNGDTLRRTEKKISQSREEFAEVWQANSDLLRALGKGSLHLFMEAEIGRRGAKHTYIGNITSRATCDLIQAVLSGSNCEKPTSTGAVGSTVLQINSDNSVSYEVALFGLSSEVTSLQMTANYRKRTRAFTDITPQYRNGIAKGILKELSAKELHILLSSEARLTASTREHGECELTGMVGPLLYSGHLARYSGLPIPLSGSLVVPPVGTGAGGHAWLHLDNNCHLHYEIVVSGLNKDADPTVAAHLHGLAEIAGVEPTHKKLLKGFYGTEARGILKEIPDELYEIMNNGSAFLQVATKGNPSGEIRGRVRIPNNCATSQKAAGQPRDESNKRVAHLDHDSVVHDAAIPQRITSGQTDPEDDYDSCHFEGKWHRHNAEWAPLYDEKCTTCLCEHGNVMCNPLVCPSLSCRNPIVVDSECCPVCQDQTTSFMGKPQEDDGLFSIGSFLASGSAKQNRGTYRPKYSQTHGGCYQDGDPRLHPRGSSWNPIIPPFGHVTCITCTCHNNDQVTCEKVRCPATPCARPVRKQSGDCCKVCPEPWGTPSSFASTHRQDGWMQDGTSSGMCSFGREIYAVGASWNPNVHRFGRIGCITCSCMQDSKKGVHRKCEKRCPPIPDGCVEISRTTHECCPRCLKRRTVRQTEELLKFEGVLQ